jgi:hypothetical protein
MRKRLLAADAATSVATAAMIAAVAPVTTDGAPAAACQPAYVAGAIYAAGVKASYRNRLHTPSLTEELFTVPVSALAKVQASV